MKERDDDHDIKKSRHFRDCKDRQEWEAKVELGGIAIFIVIWILSTLMSTIIGAGKNRIEAGFILGCILGVLGLVFIILVKPAADPALASCRQNTDDIPFEEYSSGVENSRACINGKAHTNDEEEKLSCPPV